MAQYDIDNSDENLAYVQARALNVLGLCHSRQKDLIDIGHKASDKLHAACSRLGLFDEITNECRVSTREDNERPWSVWRATESRRRTGYFIWVRILKLCIQSLFALDARSSPLLTLTHR